MVSAAKLLYGYYSTGDEWVAMQVDENGYLRVDLSAVNFTDLADTPTDYTDEGGKLVRVNAAETALEFFTASYMTALVDDTTPQLGGELDPNGHYLTGILQVGEAATPTGYDVNFYSAIGAGARMFWDESHAAFRAGKASTTQWDDGNVGNYSCGIGYDIIASGYTASAFGYATQATNTYATALGTLCIASGLSTVAMGAGALAGGDYSIALGLAPSAPGDYAIALGYIAYAYGDRAISIGTQIGGTVAYNDAILIGKWVNSGAAGAGVIGIGVSSASRLTNSTANTMMLGFGSAPSIWFGDDTLGFYSTSPIAKQTGVAVTAAGIHAALVNLGLIAA